MKAPVSFAAMIVGVVAVNRAWGAGDLGEVRARTEVEWKNAGLEVSRLPTRFMFDDEKLTIAVPAAAKTPCTSVALIGARGTSFRANIAGVEDEADPSDESGLRASSVAGLVELFRCDGEPITRVIVSSDAGRGALEVVVGRGRKRAPNLRALFPERTGGTLPQVPEPGVLSPLPPNSKRAEVAEVRARVDGATILPRAALVAGEDGNGVHEFEIDAGCHRIELFATDPREGKPTRRTRLNLDAELHDADEETLLTRDRTDAPDARLEACVAATTLASVLYAGATPKDRLILTHALWALPAAIPQIWGAPVRAKMAKVLHAQRVIPKGSPALLAQGASGQTAVPVTLEPGACYLAVVGVTHGTSRGLALRVLGQGVEAADERGTVDEASVVAFCAGRASRARIDVEAKGTSLAWGLAVFQTHSRAWDAGR